MNFVTGYLPDLMSLRIYAAMLIPDHIEKICFVGIGSVDPKHLRIEQFFVR